MRLTLEVVGLNVPPSGEKGVVVVTLRGSFGWPEPGELSVLWRKQDGDVPTLADRIAVDIHTGQ